MENILSVTSLTVSVLHKILLSQITFAVNEGEKIGLIGLNGSGKTTLLRLLADELAADEGVISKRKNLKIGYLQQAITFQEQQTILDYIFDSVGFRLGLIKQYEACLLALHQNHSQESLKIMAQLTEKMDQQNAWGIEKEIREIVAILGIRDLTIPMKSLSGGMLKIVALAKVLIDENDLLLLDEPTNHLDMDTILWLEEYLQQSKRAVILVTHDRYVLDAVCQRMYEIHQGNLVYYSGNYTDYLEKKSLLEVALAREDERVRSILKKELQWLKRQPKARTTKSKHRVARVHELMNHKSYQQPDAVELEVQPDRLGKTILTVKHLAFAYTEKPIITDFSYSFRKNDKIGLLGVNGSGKTTFLNLLAGKLQPVAGEIEYGFHTHIGYFEQMYPPLPNSLRVLDFIREAAEFITLADGRGITASKMLERFLFDSSLQYNLIGKLSGGEKRRLQLLHVLMKNPNLLLLDEPTNDLDVMTLSVLEDFLMEFPGVICLVSHDRYFIDRVCNKLLVLEEGGVLNDFPGNCSDYLIFKQTRGNVPRIELAEKPESLKEIPISKSKPKQRLSYLEKRELAELEEQINVLELEKKEVEKKLCNPSENSASITELGQRFNDLTAQLDQKNERWLILAAKEE
jgi:ATP-binding cassette subfamily F protein uup